MPDIIALRCRCCAAPLPSHKCRVALPHPCTTLRMTFHTSPLLFYLLCTPSLVMALTKVSRLEWLKTRRPTESSVRAFLVSDLPCHSHRTSGVSAIMLLRAHDSGGSHKYGTALMRPPPAHLRSGNRVRFTAPSKLAHYCTRSKIVRTRVGACAVPVLCHAPRPSRPRALSTHVFLTRFSHKARRANAVWWGVMCDKSNTSRTRTSH
ncbi:hypothetical protein J6590_067528 [Homalodisca vitripennis]|nr:hypothetical protein J6590_067528 [Homalodisca vitripennis]